MKKLLLYSLHYELVVLKPMAQIRSTYVARCPFPTWLNNKRGPSCTVF